ncbi:MAG: GNAT family N-acetyltransferase [Planctomycetaceae bacterium]|nr:GNAT family N-acetyltransferase [Planctomycetaceae bacterium]
MTTRPRADTTPLYRIRLADWDLPEDAGAIADLVNTYAQLPTGGGEALPPDVLSQLVPALRKMRGAFVLLAYHQAQPIGLAICLQGFSTFAAKPLINVHDLVVVPEHQGQGVGTQLLRSVEAHARTLGCCKVTLEVRCENLLASKLYRRLGYTDPAGASTLMLERLL